MTLIAPSFALAARKNSRGGIGLVIIEAIKRSSLKENTLSFLCDGMMEKDDVYVIRLQGTPQGYVRLDKNFECEPMSIDRFRENYPDVHTDIEMAVAHGKQMLHSGRSAVTVHVKSRDGELPGVDWADMIESWVGLGSAFAAEDENRRLWVEIRAE